MQKSYEGHRVLDLFAGSGVGVAVRSLGAGEMGVEWMPAALETRRLNGLPTVYEDVWDMGKADALNFDTIWASPPCQTFSTTGKGEGRRALGDVVGAIESGAFRDEDSLRAVSASLGDERIGLVLSPLHYVVRFLPDFVVFEQVPPVLPVWEAMIPVLKSEGYSVWCGIVSADRFGVPQSRKRAVLTASRFGAVAAPVGLDERVSMVDAFPYLAGDVQVSNNTDHNNVSKRGERSVDDVSFTITSKAHRWLNAGRPMTILEAQLIQSYPADFAFAGSKTDQRLQIGNAVPPLMAAALLKSVWDS